MDVAKADTLVGEHVRMIIRVVSGVGLGVALVLLTTKLFQRTAGTNDSGTMAQLPEDPRPKGDGECSQTTLGEFVDQDSAHGKLAPWGAKGFGRRLLVSGSYVWLSVQWRADGSGREVRLLHRERTGPQAPFAEREYVYTTSFDVLRVVGMQMGQLLIEGRTRSGDQVLEWWGLQWPEGTPVFQRPQAPAGVGVPHSGGPASFHIVGGGPVLPIADRTQAPSEQRVELYRGPILGDWMFSVVDPDGRFVLSLAKNGPDAPLPGSDAQLLRWSLDEGEWNGPEVLLEDTELPELRAAMSMSVRDHLYLGRVYQLPLNIATPGNRLILVDSNNDGAIEGTLVVTPGEAVSMQIPSGYVDDFIQSD